MGVCVSVVLFLCVCEGTCVYVCLCVFMNVSVCVHVRVRARVRTCTFMRPGVRARALRVCTCDGRPVGLQPRRARPYPRRHRLPRDHSLYPPHRGSRRFHQMVALSPDGAQTRAPMRAHAVLGRGCRVECSPTALPSEPPSLPLTGAAPVQPAGVPAQLGAACPQPGWMAAARRRGAARWGLARLGPIGAGAARAPAALETDLAYACRCV